MAVVPLLAPLARFDRQRLVPAADWAAVGVALALPWSTSATAILIVVWLIAALISLDVSLLRRTLSNAAGWLPVLLWLLAAAGMLWADVSFAERLGGLGKFHRLLFIPLLLTHFRRSGRGVWVLWAFLASVVVLLAVSWGLATLPGLSWRGTHDVGVPVKDRIFQSTDFLVCAFAVLGYACVAARERRWRWAAGAVALAGLFLGDIFLIVTSRTALLVAPLLLLLLGFRELRWKGLLGTALIGCILALTVWSGSPYLRGKLLGSIDEYRAYRDTDAPNSTGLHLEFLRKSLSFVESAPVIGHGTGSIDALFRKAAADQEGAAGTLTQNPHNQIFAVAIQLGFPGTIVLLAMWLAHLMLFRGGGLTGWIGLVIVVDNIVSSLFNSHLFDFTAGWLYVFGVGVAGGMILRERDSA